MGKLIFLLALVAACFFTYKKYVYKSPAYLAYEKFSAALGKGDCPGMYAVADDKAKAFVDELCASPSLTVYGKTFQTPSAASMINDMASTPAGATARHLRKKESETVSADGKEVSLTVVESTVMRGTAPPPPTKSTAKVRNVGGAWKVVEYADAATAAAN